MSDLISRSALINALKIDRACIYSHVFSHVGCECEEELFIDLKQLINNQPTIEAVEVVHGKWIVKDTGFAKFDSCSECGFCLGFVGAGKSVNFCPNCGADMRKRR